ncbi:MAG: hypothetical protein QOD44_32, partial [Solirubrobacteraceae bacterium]|nr:hypothetical protein [Solirubrobacteraceae bacterium]
MVRHAPASAVHDDDAERATDHGGRAGRRAVAGVASGVASGVAAAALALAAGSSWSVAALVAEDVAAMVWLLLVWIGIARADTAATAR